MRNSGPIRTKSTGLAKTGPFPYQEIGVEQQVESLRNVVVGVEKQPSTAERIRLQADRFLHHFAGERGMDFKGADCEDVLMRYRVDKLGLEVFRSQSRFHVLRPEKNFLLLPLQLLFKNGFVHAIALNIIGALYSSKNPTKSNIDSGSKTSGSGTLYRVKGKLSQISINRFIRSTCLERKDFMSA